MEKVTVYYSIQNGGDGSAYPTWFLTYDDAELDQEREEEGWGESCTGSVETYIGSNVHTSAINRSFNCSNCYASIDIETWRKDEGKCQKCKGKEDE